MSNIEQLRAEGIADRALWHFGPDTLPLRSDDPTSISADEVRVAAEATRYARAALRGEPDTLADAIGWNEDRTAALVERLQQIDSSPMTSDAGFRDAYRRLLADLIEATAWAHALRCEENGWPA